MASIPVPTSADLSAAVSAYIEQHLISTHHMKPSAAHSIAHQQTMHGAELREMTLAHHRKLFGDEITRTLYTEVRTAVLKEKVEEHEREEAARPARGAVRSEYQSQRRRGASSGGGWKAGERIGLYWIGRLRGRSC